MGYVIGKIYGPHTWAGLRSPIVISGTAGTVGTHSKEYDHGFKTTAGNGFVRTDYTALYTNVGAASNSGPNFDAIGLTASPAHGRFASLYSINGAGSSSGMLVNEDRLQFAGETAVLTSGSVTITSAAFVSPTFQVYNTYSASETITSIGLLTAF
jgi:hypothetical protein